MGLGLSLMPVASAGLEEAMGMGDALTCEGALTVGLVLESGAVSVLAEGLSPGEALTLGLTVGSGIALGLGDALGPETALGLGLALRRATAKDFESLLAQGNDCCR